jgi:uncharacterized protein YbjT (DUF2867 family)
MTEAARVALVAGGTGLVGHALLLQLADSPAYGEAVALMRRALPGLPARCRAITVDYDRLDQAPLPRADHAFCALGTTIKVAGSREAFRRVDYTYCMAFARAALAAGAKRLCVVTAAGSSPRSPLFYSRVKGELERDLAQLPFEALHIFRPSFLTGERPTPRPGERIALRLAGPLGLLVPARYMPVSGEAVAAAMIAAALGGAGGVVIHESEAIRRGPPRAA